jgi:hypothetical protein
MRDLSDWRVRAFYASCLILVPFLKFLARNEYGFLYMEVLAAVLLLAAVCMLLGLAARGIGFQILITLLIALMATYPVHRMADVFCAVPPWTLAVAIGAATWLAVRRMREKFFVVLAVFTWSGLPVEMAMHVQRANSAVLAAAKPAAHVLWLILDEHIGLAGFPLDLPQCVSAKQKLQRTLERYNFTLYPNAYANYAVTVDSVASILNGRLVRWPGELMPRIGAGEMRHYAVRKNRLFEEFTAKGYQVVAWQHGAMKICAAQPARVECREYAERLKWLHRAPGGWWQRFRWLVGSYQSGDPWLLRVKGFFPFRFGIKLTGPLALEGLWPDGLAAQVRCESRKTLFAAHLITPHSPYLYRRDGSIRPIEEWAGDRADRRVGEPDYRELYCRYCEQMEFVATQLDDLLHRLEEGGLLTGMTVVIHGDHGSRILRRLPHAVERGAHGGDESVWPGMLDYTGEPDGRDLVDKFSTLLAIKPAGATAPLIRDEKHSLLTFLSREVFGREPRDGAGRAGMVYLSDHRQALHAINIQHYWK